MTNEELIKALRAHQTKNSVSFSKRGLFRAAADALEYDEKRINHYIRDNEELTQREEELQQILDERARMIAKLTEKCKWQEMKIRAMTRKEGEWETTDNRWGCGTYRCSVCNHHEDDKTKYCPNCGADLRKGETDDNA